jgi:S1-C subfamily serine protease
MADLSTVRSSYLSHYEEVPNPLKSTLKNQLALQRIEVEMAESALASAIRVHYAYPTQYSLMNVNTARTRYSVAIDIYNALVQRYNATSSTFTQPVYLPYSFVEGTVRHGWRVAGVVEIGGKKQSFRLEEVDQDFVRLGSREEDKEVRYRRLDLLEIRVGVDRLIEQLEKLTDAIVEKIAMASGGLQLDTRGQLTERERAIVAAVLHPFGKEQATRAGLDLPRWLNDSVSRLRVPEAGDPEAPRVVLAKPRRGVRVRDPRTIYEDAAPSVALIFGKGRRASIGSGVLISGDGLILTAAHVLEGEGLEVTLPAGGTTRRYPAQLVFVNDRHDVALVRAAGLVSERWLEVATQDSVVVGDAIVAIGNPAIGHGVGEGGIAATALSTGVVAKAYGAETGGQVPSLVADITVASGSSGGPLISQATGKVVGIVTAVVSPKISDDFATSGYWALAAPSTELPRWLGLIYSR